MALRADFLAEILSDAPIPPAKLAHFRARLQDRLYEFVTTELLEQEMAGKTTVEAIAARIGRPAAELEALLAAPGDWPLDLYCDLVLALHRAEIGVALLPVTAGGPAQQRPAPPRARPATGRDPFVGIRLPPAMIEAIDAWAVGDGVTRSEAIRRLVDLGLKAPTSGRR